MSAFWNALGTSMETYVQGPVSKTPSVCLLAFLNVGSLPYPTGHLVVRVVTYSRLILSGKSVTDERSIDLEARYGSHRGWIVEQRYPGSQ